jgi:uncharacterized protein
MTHARQISVGPLARGHAAEALAFLSERPVENVIMSGFIRDHGVVSPENRGRFFGCRDGAGALVGVALLGHGVAFDARSEAATDLFAALARRLPAPRLLMGASEQVRRFWNYYAPAGRAPREVRDAELLERRRGGARGGEVRGLRPARPEEVDEVAALHAEMVREETGDDPLAAPADFRLRCLRRIERRRTWVWPDGGRIVFKAEVVAVTPEAAYVEGVYVRPGERGKGHGGRCLAHVARRLLERAPTVCLLVNERNERARRSYLRAGFTPSPGSYSILYF